MIRKLLATGAIAVVTALVLPAPAQAHPLGNFTTNQYSGLRIGTSGIDVDFILDLAELPAYQTTADIDTDRDTVTSTAERDAYAARTCTEAAAAATLTVNDRTQSMTARTVALTFPPGSGGLATLRLHCLLHADARISTQSTVSYRNNLYDTRIGWREITAVGDRYTITDSDVPAATNSARLTAYPSTTATSDVRSATMTVRPGGPAAPQAATAADGSAAQPGSSDRLTTLFTDLVGRPELTLGVGLLAILIAVILGGFHALAPGHGKTIMAAYLVTARGRLGHALTVAGTVAATHTVGVLALGILLATSLHLAPAAIYDWLRMASGVLVALVGAHLLHRAIRDARRRRAAPDHDHDHDHHHAPHARDHSHDHLPETVAASHGHHHSRTAHDHVHSHTAHDDHHAADHRHPGGHHHADGQHRAHAHGRGRQQTALTHSHGGHSHTHYLPAPDEPLRLRTLLTMGFAGGLSPSPSAVVVLLGAAALGRAWYGVLLVLAYGIGLAATLTGIGFALARWGERLRHLGSSRWRRFVLLRMPTATAATILTVGLGMTAMATIGLLSSPG
ncbi:nickel/cobalt transporter [Actinoplanes sp. NPDC051859]|uniref:nickel/cobalt transporter n=1 Tax=Actinoplanes sp. NPDC051859 TaxID=3363909 RepID=UPI0037B4E96C